MPSSSSTPQHTQRFVATLPRLLALTLALGTTGTSVWISFVAGLERGGTRGEQFTWAAVALMVLLAAHLLPALTRGERLSFKLSAALLWLVCMAGATYSHATFFLTAQQHAGAQRAAIVEPRLLEVTAPPVTVRPRDAIARDQARVTQWLASARATHCTARCAALAARRGALAAQLAALAVEADVAQRHEQAVDRMEAARQARRARQDLARLDPVTSRLAQWLRIPHDTLDLAVALGFGLLLECVACVSWMQALSRHVVDAVTDYHDRKVTCDAPVTTRHDAVTADIESGSSTAAVDIVSHETVASSPECAAFTDHAARLVTTEPVIGPEVLALANAIAAGQVRPTVADIRHHLRCSQAKAAQLRSTILATLDPSAAAPRSPRARPRLVHVASLARVA